MDGTFKAPPPHAVVRGVCCTKRGEALIGAVCFFQNKFPLRCGFRVLAAKTICNYACEETCMPLIIDTQLTLDFRVDDMRKISINDISL